MKKFVGPLFVVLIFVAATSAAYSQTKTINVRFKPGASEATFSNSVTGYGVADFVFNAKAGQNLTVTLISSTGNKAILTVLKNGLMVADDASQVTEWSGTLTSGGRHVVRVGMMRADARRTKGAVRFKLRIRIT